MVICDKCKNTFTIKAKVKKYSRGVEELYFICPQCKTRYTSYFTNASIRSKQRELQKIIKAGRDMEDIKKRQLEIKSEMEELARGR